MTVVAANLWARRAFASSEPRVKGQDADMSAYGKKTAVISLGVSCQTAWQIKKQVELVSELVEEPLKPTTYPFDWLIIPPSSFVSWLQNGLKPPSSAGEIITHPNFYWPKHNLHFWHEFTIENRVALLETFQQTQDKFNYLIERFLSHRTAKRCIFFVSNTQSNLDVVKSVSPPMDFHFSRQLMATVVASVRKCFGPASEVHFVTRYDGIGVDPDPDFSIQRIAQDTSEVLGDDAAWAEVFRATLTRRPTVQSCGA